MCFSKSSLFYNFFQRFQKMFQTSIFLFTYSKKFALENFRDFEIVFCFKICSRNSKDVHALKMSMNSQNVHVFLKMFGKFKICLISYKRIAFVKNCLYVQKVAQNLENCVKSDTVIFCFSVPPCFGRQISSILVASSMLAQLGNPLFNSYPTCYPFCDFSPL